MISERSRSRSRRGTAQIALLLILAMAAACDSSEPIRVGSPVLAEVQEEVFDVSCAVTGCHAGEDPAEGLSLESGEAYANIVGIPSSQVPELMRVEPDDAEDSYLYIKITGGDRIASGTFQMPIGSDLTDRQIALVRDWIDGGADR